jgi:hypothetical protein
MRPKDETEKLIEAQKFKTFDMNFTLDDNFDLSADLNPVYAGFYELAGEMMRWLEEDARPSEGTSGKKKTLGKDYISLHYPSLLPFVEGKTPGKDLKESVVAEMKRLFGQSFYLVPSDGLYKPKSNTLTADEKETIRSLLVNNKYQEDFNVAAGAGFNNYPPTGSYKWVKDFAWNALDFKEPYQPPTEEKGEKKRMPELEIDRDRKK